MKRRSICPVASYLRCSIQASRLFAIATYKYSSDMLRVQPYFFSKVVVGKLDISKKKKHTEDLIDWL